MMLADRPPLLETPLHFFLQDLTPNDAYFVRWHAGLSVMNRPQGHAHEPDAARERIHELNRQGNWFYRSRFLLQLPYWTAIECNDFDYTFGYRHQFGQNALNCAKSLFRNDLWTSRLHSIRHSILTKG
jgi:hypothetical protein